MTTLAQTAPAQTATEQTGTSDSAPGMAQEGKAVDGGAQSPLTQQAELESAPVKRSPAHYLWAVLIARIYEVLALLCPMCGGQMRLIAFISERPVIREILGHLGEPTSAPSLAPARGPPLWELPVAGQTERGIDPQAQPAPDYEIDQRVAW